MSKKFTHLDKDGAPGIVDIREKLVTERSAIAQSTVEFTDKVFSKLTDAGWETKKGSIFQAAIIAGTMGAKKCSELIPLCHPIALEQCKITISPEGNSLLIHCKVAATHKTGVEMEALTGVTVAALTIYDMCKAFSHEIVIQETRLIEKHGGKSDYIYKGEA